MLPGSETPLRRRIAREEAGEGCESVAADAKGQRFAVASFGDRTLVRTRRGSQVQQVPGPSLENHTGRLLGDARAPVLLAQTEDNNALTALPLNGVDVDGGDIVVSDPKLIDGGKTMVARVRHWDERDSGETLALVHVISQRITSQVKQPRTPGPVQPVPASSLTVNDAETLVAVVIDHTSRSLGGDVGGDRAGPARRVLGQHPDRGAELPGRAVAALETVELYERLLQRPQFTVVREALDRRDVRAVGGDRQRQAGHHTPSVQKHRAGAALPAVAALFRPCVTCALTERIEQCPAMVDGQTVRQTVDAKTYLAVGSVRHTACPSSMQRIPE
ncbi:hypothetical protein SAMN02787144_103321 [Streptomyces atratus]|uniref:Uncharacterized protein n=1 Tax=Streptomyces atratus TaxID=1893 RepID=A0A1K2F5L6_STRAR|nr:hypothetical protein SAMN02787144_103321 [Streptomyces atratus]